MVPTIPASHFHWTLSRWRAIPLLPRQGLSNRTSPSRRALPQWLTTRLSLTCLVTTLYPHRQSQTQIITRLLVQPTSQPCLRLTLLMRTNPFISAPWMCASNKDNTPSDLLRRTWPTQCPTNGTIQATHCSLALLVQMRTPPSLRPTTLAISTPVRCFPIIRFAPQGSV